MKLVKTLSRVAFGILFMLAGANHSLHPDFYVSMMLPYLPWHWGLVIISGIAEVLLGGLLLNARWSRWAAWSLIVLLSAVFPANIHMALHSEQYLWASPLVLWLRLPLHFVLIGWAFWYTRRDE